MQSRNATHFASTRRCNYHQNTLVTRRAEHRTLVLTDTDLILNEHRFAAKRNLDIVTADAVLRNVK